MNPRIQVKLAVFASVSSIALVAAPNSSLAQEAEQTYSAGEIVVTAQKREQSINDVGLTIQAATAEALANRGIQSVSDLSKLVAGFTATSSTFSTPVYTLRGIGLYDATIGAAPAVAIYTDEVPRNFPIMSDTLNLDVERVEVLKGPQGTLFGQSATGGAINYVVAKPTDTFEAGFDASYERFNRADVSGFISGPLSDTLRGRLAMKGVSGGAWQYNISEPGEKNGDERRIMGRFSLDWTPSGTVQIQASLTGARDRSDGQAPQHVNSFYNIYSADALAAANANPATANPYGYVDEGLYALQTNPASPGYNSTFLGGQATAVARMNGVDSLNAFSQPWSPISLAQGSQYILGTPHVAKPRAASWTPSFLRGNRDWYLQGTLRADIDLSDMITLTSITAYAKKKVDHTIDLDGTAAVSINVPSFGKVKTFNQELRLSGDMDQLKWIVGVNYDSLKTSDNNGYLLYNYTLNNPFDWAGSGIGPVQDTLNLFNSKTETFAVFGNVEYEVTDHLTVTAGLRYTKNKQDASYCYNDPASTWQGTSAIFSTLSQLVGGAAADFTIAPGDCFATGDGTTDGSAFGVATLDPVLNSQNEDNWSWRLGLNYKLDNGGLIYATASQGYKAGVFSNIGASAISQYVPAKQEKLVSYEGGFKMPFANGRIRLNGSAFYYDYSDKQVRAKVADPVWGLLERLINVPKSKVWGLEGELAAEPIDGLTFSGSATYIESKVTGSLSTFNGLPIFNNMGFTGDFKGSELPYTPNFMANADIQYEWEMGDVRPFIGGTLVYQGQSNATFENDTLRADFFEIPSYETVDLRAGVSGNDGDWKFTVYGRNVFNKYYITSPIFYHDAYFNMVGKSAVYGASISLRY